MHNLTAKYNYLYQANLILDEYELQLRDNHATNFQEILPAYISTDSLIPTAIELDKVIEKAKTIIAEKSNTKYMAQAYLLLAKANFLKGNFFLSQAYFEYVVQAYPENTGIQVKGLDGQARSLLKLGKYQLAKPILNKLALTLPGVKGIKAEPLATLAQANIISQEYTAAISYLEASIKAGGTIHDRLRRTYILAQLEERQNNHPKALYHYLKIQKSNAPFDLYFNAILNQIKIHDFQQQGVDKKRELQSLINDDKNTAYLDQLFGELADTYMDEQNFIQANVNYQHALKANTTNSYQRGQLYQKMALLNAKHFKKHTASRLYYDSALQVLPKTYAGYEQLVQAHKNMQYLSSRFEIIALQDSLQRLALLTKAERQALHSKQTPTAATSLSTPPDPDGAKEPNVMQTNEALLPLTPALLAASNHKIREAFQQLGSFYAQEMDDQDQAQNIFNTLKSRFPNSNYAKTQLNAEWRSNKAAAEQQLLEKYNEVYLAYERKNYLQVIETVDKLSLSSQTNRTLAAQFLYLRALAIGRTKSVAEFNNALHAISAQYPQDPLISPLIQSHQNFLLQHLTSFQKRKTALVDTDPDEKLLMNEPKVETSQALASTVEPTKTTTQTPIEPPGIFSTTTVTTYYFIIQVSDASINLSPSRFGIGQFNRGNYADSGLKHQLTEIDNEQLIYIGNFTNFADVKTYAEGIGPQLKQIMKVRESDYTSFIISRENFDKITSEALLKKYLEFYKNNLLK